MSVIMLSAGKSKGIESVNVLIIFLTNQMCFALRYLQ